MSALGFVLLVVAITMINYSTFEIGDLLMKHSNYKQRLKLKELKVE